MQVLRTATYSVLPANLGNGLIAYAGENEAKRAEMLPRLQDAFDGYYGELYAPIEKDVLIAQLNLYAKKGAAFGLPPMIAKLNAENGGDFTQFVNDATAKSIFTSKESVEAFTKNPDAELVKNDPLYLLSSDLLTQYRAKSPELIAMENDFQKSFRLLVEGLRESKLNAITYPDANSTLRLTYGKVRALPADKRNDAKINNYTTMDGMVKKYKKGDAEFDMPTKIIEMNKAKEYGQYADKDGFMPINFLTDNDITGGNSGSPVLNEKGELIGLAFDGNIEAMAGDAIFDPELQRTINVDIRYVLWIIDKYAGAKHIVEEMTIVK
jgi:hypothetical protein